MLQTTTGAWLEKVQSIEVSCWPNWPKQTCDPSYDALIWTSEQQAKEPSKKWIKQARKKSTINRQSKTAGFSLVRDHREENIADARDILGQGWSNSSYRIELKGSSQKKNVTWSDLHRIIVTTIFRGSSWPEQGSVLSRIIHYITKTVWIWRFTPIRLKNIWYNGVGSVFFHNQFFMNQFKCRYSEAHEWPYDTAFTFKM